MTNEGRGGVQSGGPYPMCAATCRENEMGREGREKFHFSVSEIRTVLFLCAQCSCTVGILCLEKCLMLTFLPLFTSFFMVLPLSVVREGQRRKNF